MNPVLTGAASAAPVFVRKGNSLTDETSNQKKERFLEIGRRPLPGSRKERVQRMKNIPVLLELRDGLSQVRAHAE